jgi:hypothetical protein
MAEQGVCTLHRALGRVEPCPGAGCALWLAEPGRSGCALREVERDVERSPELARYLLELRLTLDDAAAQSCDARVRSLSSRLLKEEQGAE